jgi:hypothetical protein
LELNGTVFVFAMNMMDFGGGLFPFALSSEFCMPCCPINLQVLTRSHRRGRHSRYHVTTNGSLAVVSIFCALVIWH